MRSEIVKSFVQMLLVVFTVGMASGAFGLQGGPDNFGYRYIDSSSANGPSFKWEQDIRLNEVDISNLEKNGMGRKIPLGFKFYFYGQPYDSVYLAGNGYLAFTLSDYDNHIYKGESVPSVSAPNNIIAPFWGKIEPHG